MCLYYRWMLVAKLKALISDHEEQRPFTAHEVTITAVDCDLWVRFRANPERFLPRIFEGDWANTQQHPEPGNMRIIRVMTGTDSITRVIARQGSKLYAFPWLS